MNEQRVHKRILMPRAVSIVTFPYFLNPKTGAPVLRDPHFYRHVRQ